MTSKIYTFFNFPNSATHCKQEECGFTLYRGVIVQWDEDHDTRVLGLLDEMPAHLLERLMVIQEHEAGVDMIWKGDVPIQYKEGTELYPPDGDIWNVCSSEGTKAETVM